MRHFLLSPLVVLAIVGCGSDGPSPAPRASATPAIRPSANPSPVLPTSTAARPTPTVAPPTPAPTPTLAVGQWHLLELVPGVPVYSIDVDPGAPEVVLAGTGDGETSFGVFVSRDAGRTWQPDGLPGVAVLSLAFDPAGSGVAFALAKTDYSTRVVSRRDPGPDGAWRAPDGEDATGPPFSLAATLAVGPGRLLRALADRNVCVATAGEATYTCFGLRPEGVPFRCENIHDIAIAPTDPQVVYVSNDSDLVASRDGGTSWPSISCPPTLSGRRGGIAVDPTSSLIAYAGTGSLIRRTGDGGRTTTLWDVGGSEVSALVIDPVDPSTIYAGTATGVRVSNDGGREWRPLGDHFPDAVTHDLAIDPVDGRTIHAATDAGVALFLLP